PRPGPACYCSAIATRHVQPEAAPTSGPWPAARAPVPVDPLRLALVVVHCRHRGDLFRRESDDLLSAVEPDGVMHDRLRDVEGRLSVAMAQYSGTWCRQSGVPARGPAVRAPGGARRSPISPV